MIKYILFIIAFIIPIFTFRVVKAQPANQPGNFNPLVPGYFADPSIKKFGDTYYIYATTDGVKEAYGPPQVWVSKDFVNWYNYKIDLPQATENVWAPDVVVGPDGRYYYYYCSCQYGCAIYGYVSSTPIGPWTKLNADNSPVVPVDYAAPVITLDGQILKDDDGSYWIYFCTWATNAGNGMGWAKFNPDMKSFSSKGMIPNSQLKDVFEGSFMLKRNGKYYAMYSSGDCHESSYRVQYGIGNSPNGTFSFGANNPILSTNSDGSIDGPGHHSIMLDGTNYYIIYHRHDNPHSTGGMFRQLAADKLNFDANGNIQKVGASNAGVGYLGTNQVPYTNLAYTKSATASSYYHDVVHNYDYLPSNAVDDNNGTLWRSATMDMGQWLKIDLGGVQNVQRVLTQFEYSVYYYQYKIEYSQDGSSWTMYSDKTTNRRCGSPMVDDGNISARYLRITFTGVQKSGMFPAIWNVKVYSAISSFSPLQNIESSEGPVILTRGNKLIDIDASKLSLGAVGTVANSGTLGASFNKTGNPQIQDVAGKRAITFNGSDYLKFSQTAPLSLSWNSSYTVATWVYNPGIAESECIVAWARRGGPTSTYAALNYGTQASWGAAAHWNFSDMGYSGVPSAGTWHFIALTFDGMVEKVYVDGNLNAQEQKNLFVYPNDPIYIGWSTENTEFLTGSIASLKMYDYSLSQQEIKNLMNGVIDTQAPTVPGTPSATNVTSNNVTLTWAASTDNIGVTGYDVLQNGTIVKTVSITSAIIAGLTSSTQYTFTVKAKDAAGNTSSASNALTVTTSDGGSSSNIALIATASTSYCSSWERLTAVNDNSNPSNSNDKSSGAYGNWNNPNAIEWVEYDWTSNYSITQTDVYWFDDNGGVLTPTTAYVEYWNGSIWVNCGTLAKVKDTWNTLAISNISTNKLRISMKNSTQSTGILEWRVWGTAGTKSSKITDNADTPDIADSESVFKVSPNPAGEVVNIDTDVPGNAKVSIFNNTGILVYQHTFTGKTSIKRQEIGGSGTYIYKLTASDHKVYSGKLILQ